MASFAKSLVVAGSFLTLSGMASPANQAVLQETPCGIGFGRPSAQGLMLVNDGTIVYDSVQGLCWLADANLAGNPLVRGLVHLSPTNPDPNSSDPPVINPDGTMDFPTARNWVDSLNNFNNGNGWLNHNNWQLPTTQMTDGSCSSQKQGNFGVLCNGSALGHLYNKSLLITYPNSVVPHVINFVWPFFNLQPGIYWTGSSPNGGAVTFSFNTGDDGSNTTDFNFLHVLPMTHDVLGTVAPGGASCSVLPYIGGPGAGRAVYDSCTGLSWPIDANLPAHNTFNFTGSVTLTSQFNGMNLSRPIINADGAVHFLAISYQNGSDLEPCPTASTPCPPGTNNWMVAMNNAHYAGSQNWILPSGAPDQHTPGDLDTLYADLGLSAGDVRLETFGFVGPFRQLQPGFYWTCERGDTNPANPQAPCDFSLMPGQDCPQKPNCAPQEYSFNFDDGFEGTDHPLTKHFYVMVYYPAPARDR